MIFLFPWYSDGFFGCWHIYMHKNSESSVLVNTLIRSYLHQFQGILEGIIYPRAHSLNKEDTGWRKLIIKALWEMLKMIAHEPWRTNPWNPHRFTTALCFLECSRSTEKWIHINHSIPVCWLERLSSVSVSRVFILISPMSSCWYYFPDVIFQSKFYLLIFLNAKLKFTGMWVCLVMFVAENDTHRLSRDRLGEG